MNAELSDTINNYLNTVIKSNVISLIPLTKDIFGSDSLTEKFVTECDRHAFFLLGRSFFDQNFFDRPATTSR